jgi:CRP/FNR family transcriptional regulator, cyclic AMP receptor protein
MRSQMLDRFSGDAGRRFRVEALGSQRVVMGNGVLAEELADRVELLSVPQAMLLSSRAAKIMMYIL